MENQESKNERRKKIEEIKAEIVKRKEAVYSALFLECLDALNGQYKILTDSEADNINEMLKSQFSFTSFGRINWGTNNCHYKIHEIKQIYEFLEESKGNPVFILWDNAEIPVIETTLIKTVENINDICSVSFDTWIYIKSKDCVVEYYHEGDITMGFADK